MQWLLLGVLGIIWAAFLIPVGRRRSDSRSVEDFERRMELLANAEVHGTTGRWIVTPRKGVRFLGPREHGAVHQSRVELDGRGNVRAETLDYRTSAERIFAGPSSAKPAYAGPSSAESNSRSRSGCGGSCQFGW